MSRHAQIIMVLWIPLVLLFLSSYKPRTAIIVSYLGGMLFLPKNAGFDVPGFARYVNDQATSYILVIGLILFRARGGSKSIGFRLKWIDLPMIMTCISPAISSWVNGLGFVDLVKQSAELSILWGVPYFLGRIYINQWSGLKELSISIIKGGLLYIPLCLYEVRMGPFLHSNIYGYGAHSSGIFQARRLGGWRPMVFMEHGLNVAIWMTTATLVAIWLSQTKVFYKIWQIPKVWIVSSLVITFVLLKSTGAYGYLLYGIIVLIVARYFKSSIAVWFLIFAIIFYLSGRVTGLIVEGTISPISSAIFENERNASLLFRMRNEDLLRVKALEQPIFGWGGWGRNRIVAETSSGEKEDITIIDSNWIYIFSNYGLFGLVNEYMALLLPLILFFKRYAAKNWFDLKIAPGAALSLVLLLFILDTMFNASILSIFPLICGSLASIVIQEQSNRVSKKLSKKPLVIT